MPVRRLSGLRLLVAEDESTIAMLIEDILRDEGCEIIGPYPRLPDLAAAASSQQFDGAVLDVDLHGQRSLSVAEGLAAQNVPFILMTGFDATIVPEDRPEWVICSKPFSPETLIAMIERHIVPQARRASGHAFNASTAQPQPSGDHNGEEPHAT